MLPPSERVLRAMKGGATAAELDAVLLEIKLERSIRRRAEELAQMKLNYRNLAVIDDLIKAAIELTQ